MDDNNNADQDVSQDVDQENQASVLLNLESMIKSHITGIEELEQKLSEQKGLLDGIFESDATFKEHDQKAKEAIKVRTGTKQQILKQPQAADLFAKVRDMRSELSEMQDGLSDYLREFQRMSGINEIEGNDGELRLIVYIAKLVKKSSKSI